jgi:4-hydroxy-3-methylbut-2-en-1-yl diphosphate synthase IspG/GcpE
VSSRYACPSCGRFIAESAVENWITRDDSDYYGICDHFAATCGRCGRIEPNFVSVTTKAEQAREEREYAATVADAWRQR